MFGLFKTKEVEKSFEAPKPPAQLILNQSDSLHTRLMKAAEYAGLVNANREGLIDSMYFIMSEYERLDFYGWPDESKDKIEDNINENHTT